MIRFPLRRLALASLVLAPLAAAAAGVGVRNQPGDPAAGIFPSDRYTVRDWSNTTFRRVALPKPDCALRPSDCADVEVINTLDGFSTQPRITVPFTGDIDPATVSSSTVYLLNLGDTLSLRGFGRKVGINQVLWDPATKTLAFESDELLQEHSRYVLIVTDGVRDTRGKRIQATRDDDDDDVHGRGHDRVATNTAATCATRSATASAVATAWSPHRCSPPRAAPPTWRRSRGRSRPRRRLR
ncbi:MAG: Ig-like domain-containing protein [Piscinibacter sp.]